MPSVISGMFVKRFNFFYKRQSHNFNVPIVLSADTKRTIYYNGPVLFNKFCTSLDYHIDVHFSHIFLFYNVFVDMLFNVVQSLSCFIRIHVYDYLS